MQLHILLLHMHASLDVIFEDNSRRHLQTFKPYCLYYSIQWLTPLAPRFFPFPPYNTNINIKSISSMALRKQLGSGDSSSVKIAPMAAERISQQKQKPLQLPTPHDILSAAAYVPRGVRPRLKGRVSDITDSSERTAARTPSPQPPLTCST